MDDVVLWLLVSEGLSLAMLPLCVWMLAGLPDKGYAFSKILAILFVTWVIWWLGNFIPLGTWLFLPWLLLIGFACFGWRRLRSDIIPTLRTGSRVMAIEEALFIAGFLGWALMRSFHPDISGTEKPMDLMILQSCFHSATFPPQDLWLAGHGINYYYFGYLFLSELGRMAGSSVFVTYNLSLAWLFGAALSGTYCITYALTRKLGWSMVGPTFAVLLGNSFALFNQVVRGQFPWNQTWWFWNSTRVVGETALGQATTINEFPFFSFVLGDLHPHLIAVPVVLTAIAVAISIYYSGGPWLSIAARASATSLADGPPRESTPLPPSQPVWTAFRTIPARILPMSIPVGALFAINSWDLPTYLVLAIVSVMVASALNSSRINLRGNVVRGFVVAIVFAAVAVLAFLPFYVDYQSPVHGIGFVTSATSLGQVAEIFGPMIFLIVCFLLFLSWHLGVMKLLIHQIRTSAPISQTPLAVGFSLVILLGLIALSHRWVLLLALSLGISALALLLVGIRGRMALNDPDRKSHPSDRADNVFLPDAFVLVLLTLGVGLLAVTEFGYLRDIFDGGPDYRLNSVFKLYYQVWITLGLGGAYIAVRIALFLPEKRWHLHIPWLITLAAIVGIGGIYTVLGPISYYTDQAGTATMSFHMHPLNGLGSVDPQDLRALDWVRSHVKGEPVILEATGGEYTNFARVSTFTGLPTLLGWEGHEQQWRGFPLLLEKRRHAIDEIYSTGSKALAQRLLSKYHVSLVYVGPCERQVYANGPETCGPSSPVRSAPDALTKFESFMNKIYDHDGVQIYSRPDT